MGLNKFYSEMESVTNENIASMNVECEREWYWPCMVVSQGPSARFFDCT